MSDELTDQTAKMLASKLDNMSTRVGDLADAFSVVTLSQNRKITLMSVVIGLLVVLGILVIIALVNGNNNDERLEGVVQQAICPENAFLLGGFDPSTRAEGPARQAYIESMAGMAAGREVLNCTDKLVPPRITR